MDPAGRAILANRPAMWRISDTFAVGRTALRACRWPERSSIGQRPTANGQGESADFNPIADLHGVAHGDDLSGGCLRFGGEDSDLAENLPRLARLHVLAVDGEEVAGLDGVVAPEVHLHQNALAQRQVPAALRVHDRTGAFAAGGIAERGDVRE